MAVRRARWFVCMAIGCSAVIFATAISARADEKEQPLPLTRVVLFSSSVGFFEHAGQVEGRKQIEFSFKTSDINDLLKSLVVQDRDGGLVTAVNYGSPEPLTRTLRTFTIDLTDSPSLAQIFQQLRGQAVQLETPEPVSGTVVGVERRVTSISEKQMTEIDVLNLRTEAGLRSVKIDNIARTKFLNEKVDREFQKALELLAAAHTEDQKTVKLDFRGNGKRNVAVGYIQEAPVWKTSYRLVLRDDRKPFLQGWAIVENTTAQDWKDVELTLVSGRPVSFVMDLYQPLFMSRPVITPERHASLVSRTHDQDLASREEEFRGAGSIAGRSSHRTGGAFGGMGGGGGLGGGMGGLSGAPAHTAEEVARPVGDLVTPIDPRQGVKSVATGQDVGELFRYVIKTPVSLPRNESAMLPIVNDEVQGEKVAIYNPSVHAKYPLSGLKLTNSTPLHLLQGPITLFDGDEYAGDARIEDIPPGSTRLVSYALDLETEIVRQSKPAEQTIVALSIRRGGLHVKHQLKRQEEYTIKNSGDKAKKVLLERPTDPAWNVISPQPAERTRTLHRFAVNAEPGKTAVLVIHEEQELPEEFALTSIGLSQLEVFVQTKAASPALKKSLLDVIGRKTAVEKLKSDASAAVQEFANLGNEQDRVRKNLASIPSNAANGNNLEAKKLSNELLERYVRKLGELEDQIDKQRQRVAQLRQDETKAAQELEKFLSELVAE